MAAGRLTDPMRHIRRMALLGMGGIADAQLLDLFLTQKDEAAFEALVRRHGAMVLSVCRRVLRDPHDVEDAFQATFLVFVRKAATIAKRELLGNWLYGVAFRAALKLKQAKTRRQSKERQVQQMARAQFSSPEVPDELLFWLDHELNQLPEKYRVAIVFCDLEGMTRSQAARKLGWPVGTLNWRLAKARSMVAKGLKRQGLTLSGGALAALFQKTAAAAVPTGLVASTVKTGSLLASGGAVASGLISVTVASLMEGVVKVMFVSKLKMISAIVVTVGVLGAGAGGIKLAVSATEKGEPANTFGIRTSNRTAMAAAEELEKTVHEPRAARKPDQLELGNIKIVGMNLEVDPNNSTVRVDGPGALTMLINVTPQGEKLPTPKRIFIFWNGSMLVAKKYAEFRGGVQAIVDSAKLACQELTVTLDRALSFKEGLKENQEAKIEKLVCDGKVLVLDDRKDQVGKRVQFDRLIATQLTVGNQQGPIIATGPGRCEQLTLADGSEHIHAMKMTRVLFDGRMFSNSKDNTRNSKFYENVQVFHFPTEDENTQMNPDSPPKDGFYIKCNILNVFTRQSDNKSNQLMKAEGNVFFRSQEFFGTAAVVKYDEGQDQVIFEGTPDNPAVLYRKAPARAEPQEIKGVKILHNRKTGVFHLTGVKVITGDGTSEAPTWHKSFLVTKHDMGTAARGTVLRHSLPMDNKSAAWLEITNVRSSCGCLTARVSRKVLRSNQTGFLELVLDTGRFTRTKTMVVYVDVAVPGGSHEFRLDVTAVSFEDTDSQERTISQGEEIEPEPRTWASGPLEGPRSGDSVHYSNMRDLHIPFSVPHAFRDQLTQLLLFGSWDQGQTFRQIAAATPDAKEFLFTASNDGLLWLKVVVIHRNGKREPENVQSGSPDQKIIIDTTRPVVRSLTARDPGNDGSARQRQELILAWDIEEEHLDPDSFRLEYQFDGPSTVWITIPAVPGLTGQARWRPPYAGTFTVRLTARDKAGNQAAAGMKVVVRPLEGDQGIGSDEGQANTYWRSAQSYLAAKDFSRAGDLLKKFIDLEENQDRLAGGWLALAETFVALGDRDKAREAYHKCIEFPLTPFAARARYQLALGEMDKKNYEQARAMLMQNLEAKGLVQDRSAHEESIYKIADLFYLLEDFDKAVFYYKKAIEQYPRNSGALAARDQLGECYCKLAKQALEKMNNPKNDEKKTYHEKTRQHWLSQASAVCDGIADEREHKAWHSPLSQPEINLLRKALFGAAEVKFDTNEVAEAMRRYQSIQDKHRKQVEGLIAGQRIWRCMGAIVDTPRQRQEARAATREAIQKIKVDLDNMPEEHDAFRGGDGVWTKRRWEEWAAWVNGELARSDSPQVIMGTNLVKLDCRPDQCATTTPGIRIWRSGPRF
jgi:RNA polymerase sigma factor (sigma-70 family)